MKNIKYYNPSQLPVVVTGHSITKISDNRLVLIGGYTNTIYVGTIAPDESVVWGEPTLLPSTIAYHSAVYLGNNTILVTGGTNGIVINNTAYIITVYDDTVTYSITTPLPIPLYTHASALLTDGRVLLGGGMNTASYDTAMYVLTVDIISNTVTYEFTENLPVILETCAFISLPNNRVLVVGTEHDIYMPTNARIAEVINTNTIYGNPELCTGDRLYSISGTRVGDGHIVIAGSSVINNGATSADYSIITAVIKVVDNTVMCAVADTIPTYSGSYATVTSTSGQYFFISNGNDEYGNFPLTYSGLVRLELEWGAGVLATLLNYTPRNVKDINTGVLYTSVGDATVSYTYKLVGTLNGTKVREVESMALLGIPDEQEDILYIVDDDVRLIGRMLGRVDLITPGEIIRDTRYRILGTDGFIK